MRTSLIAAALLILPLAAQAQVSPCFYATGCPGAYPTTQSEALRNAIDQSYRDDRMQQLERRQNDTEMQRAYDQASQYR